MLQSRRDRSEAVQGGNGQPDPSAVPKENKRRMREPIFQLPVYELDARLRSARKEMAERAVIEIPFENTLGRVA